LGPAELGGRLRNARVALVIGTRPEAVKLTPVAQALAERLLQPSVILTGQHSRLDPRDFGLGGCPSTSLRCPGEEDPYAHAGKVTAAVRALLRRPPRLLIVQGDTSSAFGAALAAFAAGVPVAHVEAGLRTHDPAMPWPEEEFRTAIDARAELLFAPTELSAKNLADERVPGEIHVTGNTGVDALLRVEPSLPARPSRGRQRRLLVTCHRRESWGDGLRSIASALIELAEDPAVQVEVVLPPNMHVAATMRALLAGIINIGLVAPCSHPELLRRMRDSDLVLSDSGGMQEEAPALGVPLLVLREKTERPEGIATGNMKLVGTRSEAIVIETRRLLTDKAALAAMAHRAFPYGDGKAAPRIAKVIEDWLAAKNDRKTRQR
jgi:UDP-N-acetylglucosamine 2-epimerase (non-hydrolysing)